MILMLIDDIVEYLDNLLSGYLDKFNYLLAVI